MLLEGCAQEEGEEDSGQVRKHESSGKAGEVEVPAHEGFILQAHQQTPPHPPALHASSEHFSLST